MTASYDERQKMRKMRANTSLSTRIFKNGYCYSFNSLEMPHKNGQHSFHFISVPFLNPRFTIHNRWTLNVNHFHLFILISTHITQLKNGMWCIHMIFTHEISKLQRIYSIETISFFFSLLFSVQNNEKMLRLGFWFEYTAHLVCLHTK